MMSLSSQLEAILFAAGKPLPIKRLAELTEQTPDEIKKAMQELSELLDERKGGIMLQSHGNEFELVTRPEAAEVVRQVVTMEAAGELTRASLEALTILAYRGPMTRPELEQVRGVQSSLILRNLMIRGLVEEKEDQRLGQPTYAVTFELMNALGLPSVTSLPDYEELRGNATVQDVLNDLAETPTP